VTEWEIYRCLNFEVLLRLLKNPCIFDGRNLYAPAVMHEQGIEYHSIGRTATWIPSRL
jgi:UDPglucose 6-dehydrogenase